MQPADRLAALNRLTDLPTLAPLLGLEPCWSPITLESLGASFAALPGAVFGRHDGFVAFGVEAGPAADSARRLATVLARRGSQALVAAVEPGRRRLALAVAVPDCPVATISLDRIRAVDERILARGRNQQAATALARSVGWAEALSGRSLDDRFYREFRAVLADAAAALPGRIPAEQRHGLALLSLSRILFLYFVQERGWLDGRPRFLREELDRVMANGGGVERRYLRPLFFGTLNRPADRRTSRARQFGRIPFLNGGLFEPHPLERRWKAELPDTVWSAAFERIFERYHFTIAPETGPRSRIGPDMLGLVFERVMDPADRRQTGAFYTPAPLVDRLVDDALDQWLAAALRVPPTEARVLRQRPTAAALEAVRKIRVLDPAAGTGAFLLGVLRRLVRCRVAGGEEPGQATREVVARNLHGVDLNPAAVQLAELRLWLEIIQSDPGTRPEAVEPLPNLDPLIRQGDSVFEPIDLPFAVSGGSDLGPLRRAVIAASGAAKRSAVQALARAEVRAARGAIDGAIAAAEARLGELLRQAREPTLFGAAPPPGRKERLALEQARRHRRRLRARRRQLAETGQVPWFHYGAQFADIMASGGFDLVVGNPPWVRAESLGAAERRSLRRRYRWFRGGGGARGFAPAADLSVVFVERALELLRPGGVLAFLLPAKLLTAQYGVAAREALARSTTLHRVESLGEAHGFEAAVYPLALVAGRRKPTPGHEVAIGPRRVAQATLGTAPWTGEAPSERHPPLADRFRVRLGVKTGADELFLDPGPEVEPAVIRTALRGRDVGSFAIGPGVSLVWGYDGTGRPLATLPPGAARHFARGTRRLQGRADHRHGPPWTVFRIESAFALHLVVWADLSRELAATVLPEPRDRRPIPLNTCYWIATTSRRQALALAAWLNSTPIRGLAKERATVAGSGYSRFNAGTVGSLPLPSAALTDPELVEIGQRSLDAGNVVDADRLAARVRALLGAEAG